MVGVDGATAGAAGRRRRADAERNRARIVAAALEVLLEDGVDAPLDKIAHRAGVGNATVYRNFPDRDELVRSIVIAVTDDTARFAEEALAEEPDAAQAMRRFVHQAADSRIGAAIAAFCDRVDRRAPKMSAAAEHMLDAVRRIVVRGQEQGLIRPDILADDVLLALTQLTRPLPGKDASFSDHRAHRHLDLLLDGLCTPAPSRLAEASGFDDVRGGATT